MPRAITEKRTFKNPQTGEEIVYEVYGIYSYVDGERMELNLKSLSPAEKMAFKMVMTGADDEPKAESRKATADELGDFTSKVERKPDQKTILDDDETTGFLD